jgi:hypothetical protein
MALIDRLDRGLEAVRTSPFALTSQPWTIRSGATERVMRLGFESLVVADVARSLTPGVRLPDALATRLDETLPILDDCAVTYHALLESTPPSVRRNLDARFRDEPDVAMQVAEVIHDRASAIGISNASRLRLRNIATHVGARVRRQSTSALVDDCARKIEVAVAHGGAQVRLARGPAAMAMIEAIWQQVDGVPQGGGGASSLPSGYQTSAQYGYGATAPTTTTTQATDPELVLPEPSHESPGDPELTVGGVMLGAGLGVFGISALISLGIASSMPMIVAATPAGVAVVIGLILLIVGAVQNARG